MAVLLGRTSAGATADSNAASFTAVWKFTAVATGTLTVIKAQTKVANATLSAMKLGIYLDVDGTATNATLMTTQAVDVLADAQGTGVFQATLASPQAITNGAVYWLGWRGVGETLDWQGDASGSYIEKNADFTNPYGGGGAAGTRNNIIWGEGADTAAAPPRRFIPPFMLFGPGGPKKLRLKRAILQGIDRFLTPSTIAGSSSISAALVKDARITATINGLSAISATLSKTAILTPTINGRSTISGALAVIRALVPVTINCRSTISGALVKTTPISAAINCRSTISGALTKTAVLAPTITGRSTISASLVLDGVAPVTTGSSADNDLIPLLPH